MKGLGREGGLEVVENREMEDRVCKREEAVFILILCGPKKEIYIEHHMEQKTGPYPPSGGLSSMAMSISCRLGPWEFTDSTSHWDQQSTEYRVDQGDQGIQDFDGGGLDPLAEVLVNEQ